MSNNGAPSKVIERLREIRESIQQSVTSREPPPSPYEFPIVPLDEVRRTAQRASGLAGNLGKLNPRPSGIANDVIQAGKGTMARSLNWMFRPQREYNQEVLQAIAGLASALEQSQQAARDAIAALSQSHQQKLRQLQSQVHELSELLTAKVDRAETDTRESIRDLRWSYEGALARHIASVEETRRRMNEEVRELHRRLATQAKAAATRPVMADLQNTASARAKAEPTSRRPVSASGNGAELEVDYFALEKDFRGTEAEIKSRQSFYLPYFQNCKNVLDVACGRGEFLELMREAGISAAGVDLDGDMVGRCLEKGLSVTQTDVFEHLAQIADASLDGVFCAQFVEHLAPAEYARLIADVARKIAPGGVLAIETQNPECLAIFSKSFYIDPTHVKPIPAAQLRFLFEQAGFEGISTHYLSPASRQFPLIGALSAKPGDAEALEAFNKSVADFNEAFFGGMDYAVIGKRAGAVSA